MGELEPPKLLLLGTNEPPVLTGGTDAILDFGQKKIMIVSFIFDAVPMHSLKMHARSKCAGGL